MRHRSPIADNSATRQARSGPDDLDAGHLLHPFSAASGTRSGRSPSASRSAARPCARTSSRPSASRDEAQQLLEEYKQQLAAVAPRGHRDRRARPAHRRGAARQMRGGAAARAASAASPQAQAAIEAETRQALDQIKNEVADLTLLATEKVVGARARRGRAAPPDRRGARRGRLLQAARRRSSRWRSRSRRSRLRHGAVRGGRGRRTRAERSSATSSRSATRSRRAPSSSRVLFNPAFPRRRKKQILLAARRRAPTPLVRNSLQVLVDNGRLTALADVVEVVRRRCRREPSSSSRSS